MKANQTTNNKPKVSTTQPSIVTRNMADLAGRTGNLYEAVWVISKRSRQVATKMKEELNQKLSEFASSVDNLEEVFENREQIEISKFYERMPKPTSVAIDEFLDGKLTWRDKAKDVEE
jgi:DNA-directed RNA polymerase subunit K/omega